MSTLIDEDSQQGGTVQEACHFSEYDRKLRELLDMLVKLYGPGKNNVGDLTELVKILRWIMDFAEIIGPRRIWLSDADTSCQERGFAKPNSGAKLRRELLEANQKKASRLRSSARRQTASRMPF